MERPMPLALSRISMEQSMAMDTKIAVISMPVTIKVAPVKPGTKKSTGIPMPIKNAAISATDKPMKIDFQIVDRFTG